MKLKVNGQAVECREGDTLFEVATNLGIEVPTMCHLPGCSTNSSCMICTVWDNKSGKLIPSCSHPAGEAMDIETDNDKVFEFRRNTLEMLLSEHLGDCEAPCQRVCPAHMDIPQMIRHGHDGDWLAAWKVVLADLPYPSILARQCHAPCEGGCRRNVYDDTVAISDLVRTVSDWRLAMLFPNDVPSTVLKPMELDPKALIACHQKEDTAEASTIAIVGAGPAGLAVAWRLVQEGLNVVIHVKGDRPGGSLSAQGEEGLASWVLEREIAYLQLLGVEFRTGFKLDTPAQFESLRQEFGAVVLATGKTGRDDLASIGLDEPLKANAKTWQTSSDGVFVCGEINQKPKKLVQVAVQAKQCAWMVARFARSQELVPPPDLYNSVIGRLKEGEIEGFVQLSNRENRVLAEGKDTLEEVLREAERCMHCDCRAKLDCKLRLYSDRYKVRKNRFSPDERPTFEQEYQGGDVIFESGKCVKCGICIDVSQHHEEPVGLAFTGRGYDVRTGAGLGKAINDGLQTASEDAVSGCPTGALAFNKGKPV